MASGQVNRTQRPNTWLLRPALRRDQSLDNPEPSTHGPAKARQGLRASRQCMRDDNGLVPAAGSGYGREAGKPVRDDAGGGREMRLGHALDLVTVVRRDGKQREPLRMSFVAGRDGHDERDFVRASTSALAAVQLALLAAQDGVVHLDTAVELSLGLVGLHHGIELLAHEPGTVVLDAELAGEFEARDRVLRLRDEEHSLEPLYERQERLGEDGAGLERGLKPARVALVQPALARHRVLASAASWTREAIWPAPSASRPPRIALPYRIASGTRKGSGPSGTGSGCAPSQASLRAQITQGSQNIAAPIGRLRVIRTICRPEICSDVRFPLKLGLFAQINVVKLGDLGQSVPSH